MNPTQFCVGFFLLKILSPYQKGSLITESIHLQYLRFEPETSR